MKIYTRAFDAGLGQIKTIETEVDVKLRSAVSTVSELASVDVVENDARFCLDTNHLHVYINGSWVDQGVYDISDLIQERLMQELS